MGQLHSPSAPSSHFLFTAWETKLVKDDGDGGWIFKPVLQAEHCALLFPPVTAWAQHFSQCISMMCFFCSSMLCFGSSGFTKTRKEGTLWAGLYYQLVQHKEERTGVSFAGTLYGSSTASPHYDFTVEEVWMRYQPQAHTTYVQRTNWWRILQPHCRWTTQRGPQCVPSTFFPVRGKQLEVQWCV